MKIFGVWVVNKLEDWSIDRVLFCSYRCFRESNKSRCEKVFLPTIKIFCLIAG